MLAVVAKRKLHPKTFLDHRVLEQPLHLGFDHMVEANVECVEDFAEEGAVDAVLWVLLRQQLYDAEKVVRVLTVAGAGRSKMQYQRFYGSFQQCYCSLAVSFSLGPSTDLRRVRQQEVSARDPV